MPQAARWPSQNPSETNRRSTTMPRPSTCWPGDDLDGFTEIYPQNPLLQAYYDSEILDTSGVPSPRILRVEDPFDVRFRLELYGPAWQCMAGDWYVVDGCDRCDRSCRSAGRARYNRCDGPCRSHGPCRCRGSRRCAGCPRRHRRYRSGWTNGRDGRTRPRRCHRRRGSCGCQRQYRTQWYGCTLQCKRRQW